jgi:LacI family transcriptional regulator
MRVDGLLVCNSQETVDTAVYSTIKKMRIPLVFFDRVVKDSGFSSIVFDDKKGAKSALGMIIGAGYNRIAHFCGYGSINIGRERLEGYIESLQSHGIQLKKEWIFEGGYEIKDGKDSFRRMLLQESLPEVIFAVNDRVALGAYMAASEAGLRIPDDIAIMGYGFRETTNLFTPPMAVINQDPRKMGLIASSTLFNEIKHGTSAKQVKIRIGEDFIWNRSLKTKIDKL